MAADYGQKKQYNKPLAKTALNERKLQLSSPHLDNPKRKSSLQVQVIVNNVHMTVYTNVEGDANKGTIKARLDAYTFFALLQALADITEVDKTPDGKYPDFKIPSKRMKQGGSFGDLEKESTIIIGREDDGRIFIAIVDGIATSVKFHFGPTDFHDDWTFNGKPIDKGQLSAIYANGWGKIMSLLTANVLDTHFVEPEPRDPNQGRNGQKPQAAPQSNNSAASSWGGDNDDPFPF
jgi:hypothetical protein